MEWASQNEIAVGSPGLHDT